MVGAGKLGRRMAPTEETPLPPVDGSDEHPRSRVGVILGLSAVAALMAAWIYMLFIYDPGLKIDELPDREFPTRAEVVCTEARAALAELPLAQTATDAEERADTVDRSNVILTDMLDSLEDLRSAVPDEGDRRAVGLWIEDWRAYVVDRREYVDNLRRDDEARFLESVKGTTRRGITLGINHFAEINRMPSCATPGDLS